METADVSSALHKINGDLTKLINDMGRYARKQEKKKYSNSKCRKDLIAYFEDHLTPSRQGSSWLMKPSVKQQNGWEGIYCGQSKITKLVLTPPLNSFEGILSMRRRFFLVSHQIRSRLKELFCTSTAQRFAGPWDMEPKKRKGS